jgi:hypothetical protein
LKHLTCDDHLILLSIQQLLENLNRQDINSILKRI